MLRSAAAAAAAGGGPTASAPTTPVKEPQGSGGGSSTRSLHTPVSRSRLNSKDAAVHQSDFGGFTTPNRNSHGSAATPATAVAAASGHSGSHSNLTSAVSAGGLHSPDSPTPRRTRFNSRDIPRSYSGQYHAGPEGTDLLPLECRRSQQSVASNVSLAVFLSTYLTIVLAMQCTATLVVTTVLLSGGTAADGAAGGGTADSTSGSGGGSFLHHHLLFPLSSWTVTNAAHCLVTILYLHWFKGSYLLDEQGELNAMTVWEQLEATPESTAYMRRTLLIVPTVLAYMACVTTNFQPVSAVAFNVALWSVSMLAKLPMMNGVRLFGINRTAGIDDGGGDAAAEPPPIPHLQQQLQHSFKME